MYRQPSHCAHTPQGGDTGASTASAPQKTLHIGSKALCNPPGQGKKAGVVANAGFATAWVCMVWTPLPRCHPPTSPLAVIRTNNQELRYFRGLKDDHSSNGSLHA